MRILGNHLLKEPLAKLKIWRSIVIPGKRSAIRNPGLSNTSGFRLSPE